VVAAWIEFLYIGVGVSIRAFIFVGSIEDVEVCIPLIQPFPMAVHGLQVLVRASIYLL
jgi:hypothetical protein